MRKNLAASRTRELQPICLGDYTPDHVRESSEERGNMGVEEEVNYDGDHSHSGDITEQDQEELPP